MLSSSSSAAQIDLTGSCSRAEEDEALSSDDECPDIYDPKRKKILDSDDDGASVSSSSSSESDSESDSESEDEDEDESDLFSVDIEDILPKEEAEETTATATHAADFSSTCRSRSAPWVSEKARRQTDRQTDRQTHWQTDTLAD